MMNWQIIKLKKAYAMSGLIKRNFSLLCRHSFVMLYKTMVISHLGYGITVCHCCMEALQRGLIKDPERVQMKATKWCLEWEKSYKERLIELKLPTLKYTRIRGDMIEVYKLLTNKYDDNTVYIWIWILIQEAGLVKNLLLRHVNMIFGRICSAVEQSILPNGIME